MKSALYFIILSLSPAAVAAGEPTFSEMVKAAYAAEHLGWEEISDWKGKMRKAPWFPKLYLGYDHALRETDQLSISDNISVSSGDVTVGPRENDFDQTVNNGSNFHVRAVWALDQIVFPSSSLPVRGQMNDLMKARLSFQDHLFKIYEERAKLRSKGGDRWKFKLLTERLNAMTGGIFADRWRN